MDFTGHVGRIPFGAPHFYFTVMHGNKQNKMKIKYCYPVNFFSVFWKKGGGAPKGISCRSVPVTDLLPSCINV